MRLAAPQGVSRIDQLESPADVMVVRVPVRMAGVKVVAVVVMPPRRDRHEHRVNHAHNRRKQRQRLHFGGQVIHV
jgi:hypothetical protein